MWDEIVNPRLRALEEHEHESGAILLVYGTRLELHLPLEDPRPMRTLRFKWGSAPKDPFFWADTQLDELGY